VALIARTVSLIKWARSVDVFYVEFIDGSGDDRSW
jgi:hypothetical protein